MRSADRGLQGGQAGRVARLPRPLSALRARAASQPPLLVLFLLGSQEPPSKTDFDRDIRPIFQASCVKCHGAEGKPKGQFRLDLRAAAFRGGTSGKAIVPGKPAESPLYKLLLDGDEDVRMPQKALWSHQDQRLSPIAHLLPPQNMEILCRGRGIYHLDIVLRGHRQKTLQARARMLGALTFITVRQ